MDKFLYNQNMRATAKPIPPWLEPFLSWGMTLFLLLCAIAVLIPDCRLFPFSLLAAGLAILDLGIHELGHMVCGFMGLFIHVLAGSAAQILAPLLLFLLASWQKKRLSAWFFLFWVGQSFTQIAPYIGDARARVLTLFSPLMLVGNMDTPIHDWNYLLSTLHLLEADQFISALTGTLGVLLMGLAIIGPVFPPHQWLALWRKLNRHPSSSKP